MAGTANSPTFLAFSIDYVLRRMPWKSFGSNVREAIRSNAGTRPQEVCCLPCFSLFWRSHPAHSQTSFMLHPTRMPAGAALPNPGRNIVRGIPNARLSTSCLTITSTGTSSPAKNNSSRDRGLYGPWSCALSRSSFPARARRLRIFLSQDSLPPQAQTLGNNSEAAAEQDARTANVCLNAGAIVVRSSSSRFLSDSFGFPIAPRDRNAFKSAFPPQPVRGQGNLFRRILPAHRWMQCWDD
jgi:hypothetical protein